ncbi:MAG: hypothetical protein K1X67_25250 [Fimbriimonadaceae bacterium]|nr:hypothetical protein [Fimbriimonadaceae bacterium]
MKTSRALFLSTFVASLPLIAALGCGGGGSALGRNSDVQVIIDSNNLNDLELIVSPTRGGPDAFDRCSIDDPDLWCTTQAGNSRDIIRFTTNSQASSDPYYVWVRNLSGGNRSFTLEVVMDGGSKYLSDITMAGNRTDVFVEIRRNNASPR